jgi:hypothetical protein
LKAAAVADVRSSDEAKSFSVVPFNKLSMRSSTDANPRLGFRGYEPCVVTSYGTAFWDTGWNTTMLR